MFNLLSRIIYYTSLKYRAILTPSKNRNTKIRSQSISQSPLARFWMTLKCDRTYLREVRYTNTCYIA